MSSSTASSVLGTAVYDEAGERLGRIDDLVIDVRHDLDRVPVTGVVIDCRADGVALVPWSALSTRAAGGVQLAGTPEAVEVVGLSPTELLVGQDVMDTPAVTSDPPRRGRVADVELEVTEAAAWVTGLDLSTTGALRRLLPWKTADGVEEPVPLSQVHLASRRGHEVQLGLPHALVFALDPRGLAELLTRLSVSHARDVARVADPRVLGEALALLHPRVRARVTGIGQPARRVLRLGGWRIHRPGEHRSDEPGSG